MKINVTECLHVIMNKDIDVLTRLISLRKIQLSVHSRRKFRKTKAGQLHTNVKTRLWESLQHHTIVAFVRCIETDEISHSSKWHGMPILSIYKFLGESIRTIRPKITIMGSINIDKFIAKRQDSKGFVAYLHALDILIRADEPTYSGRSRLSLSTVCGLIDSDIIKLGANSRAIMGFSHESSMASAFHIQTHCEKSELFRWRSGSSLSEIINQVEMLEKEDYIFGEMISLNAKIARLSQRYKQMPEFLHDEMARNHKFQPLPLAQQQAINEYRVGSAGP